MTDPHSGSPTFQSLGLAPPVMDGIRDAGFTVCTPIQAQTLPIALAGRDVAGQAQTGTGKTAVRGSLGVFSNTHFVDLPAQVSQNLPFVVIQSSFRRTGSEIRNGSK